MERQNKNAMELAKFLSDNEKVRKVYYPGLPDLEYHEIAKKVLKGNGGMTIISTELYSLNYVTFKRLFPIFWQRDPSEMVKVVCSLFN